MTATDLRLEFKMDTGYYPNDNNDTSIFGDIIEYIEWLESKVLKHEN